METRSGSETAYIGLYIFLQNKCQGKLSTLGVSHLKICVETYNSYLYEYIPVLN
jgi:hypothetical protein